jgi:integrase
VFSNSQGRPQTKRNIQQRLKRAIEGANTALADAGIEPLSEEVTPYSFRRTYSSLRASRWIDAEGQMRPGDDPVYIAEQMGHTDPKFTFRVYQRAVKRRERLSGAHLEAFDKALQWAAMGSGAPGPVVPNLPNAASIQGMPG